MRACSPKGPPPRDCKRKMQAAASKGSARIQTFAEAGAITRAHPAQDTLQLLQLVDPNAPGHAESVTQKP